MSNLMASVGHATWQLILILFFFALIVVPGLLAGRVDLEAIEDSDDREML